MKLVIAALIAGIAVPAPASAAGTYIAAPADDAERLVGLMASDDVVVRIAVRLFDAHVQNGEGLSPERKALLDRDPGFKQYVAAQSRDEVAGILKRELPTLRTQLAALLTREMTAQEITETLSFFSTPTGQKMLAQVYRGVGESGAKTEQEAQQAAMTALMASLTSEDYPALMAFGATSGARKLQTINPKISATSRAWAQEVVTRSQPRMKQVVERAAAEYRAKNQ